jgi:hypothetical protein
MFGQHPIEVDREADGRTGSSEFYLRGILVLHGVTLSIPRERASASDDEATVEADEQLQLTPRLLTPRPQLPSPTCFETGLDPARHADSGCAMTCDPFTLIPHRDQHGPSLSDSRGCE